MSAARHTVDWAVQMVQAVKGTLETSVNHPPLTGEVYTDHYREAIAGLEDALMPLLRAQRDLHEKGQA